PVAAGGSDACQVLSVGVRLEAWTPFGDRGTRGIQPNHDLADAVNDRQAPIRSDREAGCLTSWRECSKPGTDFDVGFGRDGNAHRCWTLEDPDNKADEQENATKSEQHMAKARMPGEWREDRSSERASHEWRLD